MLKWKSDNIVCNQFIESRLSTYSGVLNSRRPTFIYKSNVFFENVDEKKIKNDRNVLKF